MTRESLLGLTLLTSVAVACRTAPRSDTENAEPARYRAAETPRSYRTLNPHHMYWVQGIDTIGFPARPLNVERQWWTGSGDELRVIVHHIGGGLQRELEVDTFDVAPNGRVRAINGDPEQFRGRLDLVPRLPVPARTLAPGVAWHDSIGFVGRGPADQYAYVITRNYHVSRMIDSLGGRLAEIRSEGRVRYRDAYWVDSTAGTYVWLDVSGPMRETALIDPERGTLVHQRWEMDLRGIGGRPEGAGMDTMPAGLRSASDQSLISETSADLLLRELPAGDTTLTVAGAGGLFLHTVHRAADSVASSLVRVDGLVGTTEAVFAGGRPVRFRSLWTDSTMIPSRTEIAVRGDSLVVRDTSERVVGIPAFVWAIADYAMSEHLVPVFRSLPADGETRPIAIYRPVADRWDLGVAIVQPLPDGILAVVQPEGDDPNAMEAYIIVDDGDLLFGENSGPRGAQRLPKPGTPRRERLDTILAGLLGR